jgi:hypothetical protein
MEVGLLSIVTSKRPGIFGGSFGPLKYKYSNASATPNIDGTYSGSMTDSTTGKGYQTTTSFRTGRGVPSPEDQISGPQNEAGVYHYLNSLNQESGDNVYSPGDNGHEFSTSQDKLGFVSHRQVLAVNSFAPCSYSGPLYVVDANGSQGSLTFPGSGSWVYDSNRLGAEAIAAVNPINPSTDLALIGGQTIQRSEFPEIPTMEGKAAAYHQIGHEFLNTEFGWLPFIADVKSVVQSVSSYNNKLRQLHRDSGRLVRRHFVFEDVHFITRSLAPNQFLGPVSIIGSGTCFNSIGASTTITEETHAVWFKGAFMYYLPVGNNILDKFDRYDAEAQRLLGADLNPYTLYQLSPWTWLADWFGDFGDVIKNMTNVGLNGLVLKYGYLMHHSVVRKTQALSDVVINTSGGHTQRLGTVSTSYITEKKTRTRATPYGFGVNTGTLSDIQWAILGALGLTRAPKILHSSGK